MSALAVCIAAWIVFVPALYASTPASTTPATGPTTRPTPQPRTAVEKFKSCQWDASHRGRPIDLAQYTRTFNDDFKTLSVTRDTDGEGPWYAPGHAPWGGLRFGLPGPGGPFAIVDDGLRIRAEPDAKGRWQGGCMQTVNTRGQGFAQKYGYFEMTARFGPGKGLWGAFWLKSQEDYAPWGRTLTRTEIDIVEFYGDQSYHATVHLWPAAILSPDATITKHLQASAFAQKATLNFYDSVMVDGVVPGFHAYGGEITPRWVIIYFDRKEVCRIPMVDEWKTPLYMLVDMAKQDRGEVVPPLDMVVKNVSAYLPKTPYEE